MATESEKSKGLSDKKEDLLRRTSCKKNQGHKNFIPVEDFDVKHLSNAYGDKIIVEAIKTLSFLTVHVMVKEISGNRPETYPGTKKAYPLYGCKGTSTSGTGFIRNLKKFTKAFDVPNNELCKCSKCLNSKISDRKSRFAQLSISTAGHVVFDQLEGINTTCCLFFDSGDFPPDCKDVVQLSGMVDVNNQLTKDLCEMKYFTHEEPIIKKLEEKLKTLIDIETAIEIEYDHAIRSLSEGLCPENPQLTSEIPVIVTSHPHGCSKQVSVGDLVTLKKVCSVIGYTAPTCPGSSGAPVFFIAKLRNERITHLAGDQQCSYGRCRMVK